MCKYIHQDDRYNAKGLISLHFEPLTVLQVGSCSSNEGIRVVLKKLVAFGHRMIRVQGHKFNLPLRTSNQEKVVCE